MPESFESYDRARVTVIPVEGEDAVILSPLRPRRVLREVFTALVSYSGLSQDTRRHLIHAFKTSQLNEPLERRVLAALSERWDGESARGLSDALADIVWEHVVVDTRPEGITLPDLDGDFDAAAV